MEQVYKDLQPYYRVIPGGGSCPVLVGFCQLDKNLTENAFIGSSPADKSAELVLG